MDAGRELDRLVAEKILGWKHIYAHDNGQGVISLRGRRNSQVEEFVPYYSTDMNDAWKVVEELSRRGLNLHLFVYAYDRAYAVFGSTTEIEGPLMAEASGPYCTQVAICLAALKACGIEVPD